MDYRAYLKNHPDKEGRYGEYGGAYLTDELKPAFEEITEAYQTICILRSSSASFGGSAANSREGRRRCTTASGCPDRLATARYT